MHLVNVLVALAVVGIVAWLMNLYIPITARVKAVLNIVLALIVIGIGLWLVNTYIPMAGSIRAILNIVVVVATCVGVLQAAGVWGEVERLWGDLTHRIPR